MYWHVERLKREQHNWKLWQRARILSKRSTSSRRKRKTSRQHTSQLESLPSHLVADCKFCGRQHEKKKEKCPAFGKTCSTCGKNNHFAAKCEAKKACGTKGKTFSRKKVYKIDDNAMFTYSSEEILSMTLEHSANAVSRAKYQSKIHATMEISGQQVKMQVDSGVSCNVMPRKLLPKDTVIPKTDLKLTSYSKTNLEVLGLAKISQRTRRNTGLSSRSLMKTTRRYWARRLHNKWN